MKTYAVRAQDATKGSAKDDTLTVQEATDGYL
jgi:hypothetical protein